MGRPDRVGRERVQAIGLAASEALTNVVLYAYPWRTGEIHVTARVAGNETWVLIADSGCRDPCRPRQ